MKIRFAEATMQILTVMAIPVVLALALLASFLEWRSERNTGTKQHPSR